MLSEEMVDKVVDKLVDRIREGNEDILRQIGENIRQLGTLSPEDAHRLGQTLKYGGSYKKIAKRLADITNMNIRDIYEIFEEIAKKDYDFAKKFYDYKGIDYIPFNENKALKRQIRAIANITAKEYENISKTLAFATRVNGKLVYTDISRTYQRVIDKAVISVTQGKETFDSVMKNSLKELGQSGIRTVDFESGKSMRLDSAVRMCLKAGITNMHDDIQKQLGKEFDSDGVEISVHSNPAPDHEDAQGKQFSNKEYAKLQRFGHATTYDDEKVDMHVHTKEGVSSSFRPIGDYNCYHYIFAIILGVSQPNYSKKQLQELKDKNHTGFDIDGKHYTMYQGTQLQRKLEVEIRKAREEQIIARGKEDKQWINETQQRITQLMTKYRQLSRASKLPLHTERMTVHQFAT